MTMIGAGCRGWWEDVGLDGGPWGSEVSGTKLECHCDGDAGAKEGAITLLAERMH